MGNVMERMKYFENWSASELLGKWSCQTEWVLNSECCSWGCLSLGICWICEGHFIRRAPHILSLHFCFVFHSEKLMFTYLNEQDFNAKFCGFSLKEWKDIEGIDRLLSMNHSQWVHWSYSLSDWFKMQFQLFSRDNEKNGAKNTTCKRKEWFH